MPDLKRSAFVLAALLSLAACGGGSTNPTGSPASAGSTQTVVSGEPSSGSPTDEPGATPAETTTGGGGGGGAPDACALVTADEAAGILGIEGVTTELTPGDFSYCFYSDAAGDLIAASSYTARGGHAAFDIWKAGAGVQEIDGIGDDAVFDPSSATLFVSKSDALLGMTAGIGTDPEAQRLDWARQFGQIAAGRM